MPVFVSASEGTGPTTTIRHSWRLEVFSEFGDDPLIKAHREEVEYDNETGKAIRVTKLGIVQRRLSELNPGPVETIANLAALADTWEIEDAAKQP